MMVEYQELNQFPMVVYVVVADPQPNARTLALGGRFTTLVRRVPGEVHFFLLVSTLSRLHGTMLLII